MSRFSFTSPQEYLIMIGILALYLFFIWLGIKDDTYPDGRKRHTNFWGY